MSFQIFGTTSPLPNQAATMLGFLVNYQKTSSTNSTPLMETYSPDQLTVLSGLARNYAVGDAWYASAPCETWPNRAFVHSGTSNGRVNNWPYSPFDFDVPTIFNVLEAHGNTWAVYNPGPFTSLTRLQLPRLYDPGLNAHFLGITDFIEQAKEGTLPSYSFVEPSFLGITQGPSDQHPPHDVCLGEQFLLEIYSALASGKNWEQTLLVITYDEHGGCPDHVPAPWGAVTPERRAIPARRVSTSIASASVSRPSWSHPGSGPEPSSGRRPMFPLITLRSWRPFATGWRFPRA